MLKLSSKVRQLQRPAVSNFAAMHAIVLLVLLVQISAVFIYTLLLLKSSPFGHMHPRMVLVLELVSPLVILGILTSWSGLVIPSWQKRGVLRRPKLKLNSYLNYSFERTYPIFADKAWDTVIDALRSHTVKTAETRLAHWEPQALSPKDKCARFALTYTRVPLGTKVSRFYPRTVECTVRLLGTGISTIVEVNYHAHSSMDYQIVSQMIDQTNEQIERTLTAVSCRHELSVIASRNAS